MQLSHTSDDFCVLYDQVLMSIFSAVEETLSESSKVRARQAILAKDLSSPFFTPLLFDPEIVGKKNCENLVGQVTIPVGIAGPVTATLTTDSSTHQLDLLIPLATTEGALVASINRGCKILRLGSNTKIVCSNVGMTRAPVFACTSPAHAAKLKKWLKAHLDHLGHIGEATSHHLTYLDCQLFQQSNLVFARFAFDTGDAMGMNMVTHAASAISDYIIAQNPGVTCPALSSNLCTDKKVSRLNHKLGRARMLTVTADLSTKLITQILKTTPKQLMLTYRSKIVHGSKLAGLSGYNMQLANTAVAILIATGQDPAHTVDISQGDLTLKLHKTGIHATLYLPTVPVGTIGGGTYLESQSTARSLISQTPVTPDVLAATIGVACLAGELSGLGALASSTLSCAHLKLSRGQS